MNDTTAKADAVRLNVLRAMSPARRLSMATSWSMALRDMIQAGLKKEFNDATDLQRKRLLADRWLGADLAAKVYGPHQASWTRT